MLKFWLGLAFSFVFISCVSEEPETPVTAAEELEQTSNEKPVELIEKTSLFERNSSVYNILLASGHSPIEIAEIVKAAKPIYDLSKIQAGTKYTTYTTSEKVLKKIIFHISNIQRLALTQKPGKWETEFYRLPTTTKYMNYSGEVSGTLWESSERAGMVPYLITALAEVFSWEIDFSREIRNGDRWNFTVEEILAEGKHVGWGKILYAQYTTSDRLHQAYYYKNSDREIDGHFNREGQSMRRAFLKSPMKFGRVTSRFSLRRYHPIRKVYRPHLGVDYGAPRGTPVRTIGDGRIVQIGRRGGAGKMITIKHPGGYKTRYLHLNGYKRGMKRGKRVKQGQVIGYVGTTGLSTGPHLHFELFKNGRYKDPLKIKMPPSSSIPKDEMVSFKKHVMNLEQSYGQTKSIPL